MKLTFEYANEWLDKLKKYWWKKNVNEVITLFKETEFYQETAFSKPYTTFNEIKNEWQYINEQNIKNIEFKILAIDNNVLIVEWLFEIDDKVFDGIYEIKFNDNLHCIYFKSWEMEKK